MGIIRAADIRDEVLHLYKNGGGNPDSARTLPQYVSATHRGQGVAVPRE